MHRPRCPHRVLGGICLQRSRCTSRLLPKYQNNGRRLPRSKPATPQSSGGLTALAKERGFFVESDRMTGTTKLLDITGLEVEFLIRKMGEGKEPALKTNIGVTAQALWHMDVILKNTINVRCLSHVVTVPIPEAHAIHKMIINSERGKKAEKDAHAVENMLPLLDEEKLNKIFSSLSKKEKARVRTFAETCGVATRILEIV